MKRVDIKLVREFVGIHHLSVGNTDFWLNTLELVKLYKKLGHVKL